MQYCSWAPDSSKYTFCLKIFYFKDMHQSKGQFPAVFWSRDILRRIRILLLSSEIPTKISFFLQVFCLLLTVDAFSSVLKDNKSLRSQKTEEIEGFLNFLLNGKIRIRILEAQKLTDPSHPSDSAPNSEHWFHVTGKCNNSFYIVCKVYRVRTIN